MSEFVEVTVYCNWCYKDCYGSADWKTHDIINDGDVIEVWWPDNNKSIKTVRVEQSSETGSDHGHACEIPISRAFVVQKIYGTEAMIPLKGHRVRVISRKEQPKPERSFNPANCLTPLD